MADYLQLVNGVTYLNLLDGIEQILLLGGGPPPLTIDTTSLPTPILSQAYSQTVSTSGGTAPVTFAITSGGLPAGLSLNASTGAITGTPTASGAYSFTVTATEASATTASRAYSGTIAAADPTPDPVQADTHDGGASDEHIRYWRKLAKREDDKRKAREARESSAVEKIERPNPASTTATQPHPIITPIKQPELKQDFRHLTKLAVNLEAMLHEQEQLADEDDVETLLMLA